MAILGVGFGLDRFAEADFGLDEIELHPVTTLESVGDDFQVQIALSGNHGLVQFGIDLVNESRILIMQGGQAHSDFLFLALGLQLQGDVDVGFRVLHLGQEHGMFMATQGIAGVRGFQFHHRADVTGNELASGHSVLPVHAEDLPHAFRGAARVCSPGPFPSAKSRNRAEKRERSPTWLSLMVLKI